MKKALLLVLALFLSSTLLLTGCGNKGLKNNPDVNAPVISNGGMTVTKGDYLYFVNGFKSYDGLTKDKDNVWGKQIISSIYRTKINNNTISHDEDGFLSKAEVVVPQIVGNENASFYIFGNYIYYATPNMQVDKQGNLLNARSNLCRVNINGLNNKVLYTTEATLTNVNWTMYEIDGTVYMIVYDNNKIVTVNASAGKAAKTIAKDVTSTALIYEDKYIKTDNSANKTINGVNNYVYYTRAITEDDGLKGMSGNILARVLISGGSEEIVNVNNQYTYAINTAKNGCIYYTKTDNITTIATLCKYKLSDKASFVSTNETAITNVSYAKVLILDSNNENYIGNDVVAVESNKILLINKTNIQQPIKTIYNSQNTLTAINLYGDTLFYIENSKIYYMNVRATNPSATEVITDSKTLKTDVNTFFDYDGRNVFYYVSYTAEDGSTNYYLNRTDLKASEIKSEFIGVFDKNHTPAKPDEDSDDIWIK